MNLLSRVIKPIINDLIYLGLPQERLLINGDRSISYGSTQEHDIWKFNIGGIKISSGYRYKSGHAVPSVNVGYENKISKNKTAFTFEFRGLKNK